MKRIITLVILGPILLLPATASARPPSHHAGLSWSGYAWHVHAGRNGAGQCQSPAHVSTSTGALVETISGGCGGGVSMATGRHLGSWSVTYRMSRGGGKYAIMLWPDQGSRPEVDFAEDKPSDSNRSLVTGTFHPRPGCAGCIHVKLAGDYTAWHTAGVRWDATGWTLLMDGRAWAHFQGSYGGSMHLAIQTAPWGSSGSSRLEVASVRVG